MKKPGGFQDLDVYNSTFEASIEILRVIAPSLPPEEKDDLGDQMRRASKAVPRLIAEGHAKRHQKRGFQKYIDDARAESNEMMVCLGQCMQAYPECVDVTRCRRLLGVYDTASKQLFRLREAWHRYHAQKD